MSPAEPTENSLTELTSSATSSSSTRRKGRRRKIKKIKRHTHPLLILAGGLAAFSCGASVKPGQPRSFDFPMKIFSAFFYSCKNTALVAAEKHGVGSIVANLRPFAHVRNVFKATFYTV